MNQNDIRLIKFGNAGTKRFGYWIHFRDRRNLAGLKARKSLIKFFDSCFGPLGDKWQYTKTSADEYIVKVEDEKHLMIFLLKLK
jgi:hypothetical protein